MDSVEMIGARYPCASYHPLMACRSQLSRKCSPGMTRRVPPDAVSLATLAVACCPTARIIGNHVRVSMGGYCLDHDGRVTMTVTGPVICSAGGLVWFAGGRGPEWRSHEVPRTRAIAIVAST